MDGNNKGRCEPVFFRQKDFEAKTNENQLTTYEVCMAVAAVVGKAKVDGAQNIRGTGHIYLNDRTARLELCVRREIKLKGIIVPIFNKNQTLTKQD